MGEGRRRGVAQESKIRPQTALFPTPGSLGFTVSASGVGVGAAITKSEIIDSSYHILTINLRKNFARLVENVPLFHCY